MFGYDEYRGRQFFCSNVNSRQWVVIRGHQHHHISFRLCVRLCRHVNNTSQSNFLTFYNWLSISHKDKQTNTKKKREIGNEFCSRSLVLRASVRTPSGVWCVCMGILHRRRLHEMYSWIHFDRWNVPLAVFVLRKSFLSLANDLNAI